MKKYFFLSALFLTIMFYSFGQISQIGNIMAGPTSDAEKLLQEYFKPYGNAFGANLSSGWYNTAKNHKLLGFDLTASITTSFIPKADKQFDISTLGLSNNPASASTPSIAGKTETGATMSYTTPAGQLSYKLPEGLGLSIIPSPMFQFGLGLVKGTDITFRYVPDLNIGDVGEFGLWGVGIKHSIKQYIPAIKLMPFFNLSVFVGYTKLHTFADITFKPSDYNSFFPNNTTQFTDPTDGTYDNQRMEMLFTGFTSSVLVSFDLPVVTFYGGVGFANTKTNLDLVGNYPILNAQANGVDPIANPLSIEITSSTGTKPRLNAGIKFKMAIITFHVDYTYASYSLGSAGLGISFR